jgi:hypothetical protein
MNYAVKTIAHEIKIRRVAYFTPPQNAAHAAHCGLVLHRRSYFRLSLFPTKVRSGTKTLAPAIFAMIVWKMGGEPRMLEVER